MGTDVVAAYLRRTLTLFKARNELPSEADMQRISKELGMTDAHRQEALTLAQKLEKEATDHLENQRFNEAIDAALQATLLTPLRIEPMHLLAKAYGDRFRETGEKANATVAAEISRRCLLLINNRKASSPKIAAQSATKATPKTPAKKAKNADDESILSWKQAALIVFVLIVLGSALMTCAQYIVSVGSP